MQSFLGEGLMWLGVGGMGGGGLKHILNSILTPEAGVKGVCTAQ
jgi:hypothetical protein